MSADQITDATLAEVESEVDVDSGGDGVWIAPGFAEEHDITPAQEARLEQAVAAGRVRAVAVVLPGRRGRRTTPASATAPRSWRGSRTIVATGGNYVYRQLRGTTSQ